MKKLLLLLLILFIIGILMIGSDIWEFSREDYISQRYIDASTSSQVNPDFDFLQKEFSKTIEE